MTFHAAFLPKFPQYHLMEYPPEWRRGQPLKTFCDKPIANDNAIINLPVALEAACYECRAALLGKVFS